MHRNREQNAFTLIELLIAVAILGLMLSLISVIFNETSNAVSTGIQTSEVVAKARTMGEQMQQDFDAMLGPGGNSEDRGFLVIINRQIDAVDMPDGQNSEQTVPETIRSDQIAFIRGGYDSHKALTPKDNTTYGNDITAQHARIWYGHLAQVSGGSVLSPGDAQFNQGIRWTLGRQALLLAGGSPGPAPVYVNGTEYNDPVTGRGGDPLFVGITDLSNRTLADTTGAAADIGANNDTDYLARTFEQTRLRYRPKIRNTSFPPAQVAQMHPHLARGVSDFAVDFAADLNNNDRIDRATDSDGDGQVVDDWDSSSNDNSGEIVWYDGDHFQANAYNWYSGSNESAYSPYIPDPNGNGGYAFVWRYHDDANNPGLPGNNSSKWPYLIRIRYRLHDSGGEIASTDSSGDVVAGRWFEHILSVDRP